MKQFRVVAVIDSPDLGEIIGTMQEAGCLIQGLDLMGEAAPTRRMLEIQNNAVTKLPKLRIAKPKGTAPGFVQRFLTAIKPGDHVRRRDIMKAGMALGFDQNALSTAIHTASHRGHLVRVTGAEKGTYTIPAPQQPPQGEAATP